MTSQQTSPESTTSVAGAYRAKADAIAAVVDGAAEAHWRAASPCAGWAASDVLTHLVDTQNDFLATHDLTGSTRAEESNPARQWTAHTEHVAALLDIVAVADKAIDGFFGPTTIGATISQFYGWDMLVHRWDLGQALGRDAHLSEGEVDDIEAALPMFGEQLYMPGICSAALDVGADQPREVQVLARLGRDARNQ